jgi:hypothetical protein
MLFNQHFRELRNKSGKVSRSEIRAAAEKNAAADLEKYIVALQSSIPARVECVKVSTDGKYPRVYRSFTITFFMRLTRYNISFRTFRHA